MENKVNIMLKCVSFQRIGWHFQSILLLFFVVVLHTTKHLSTAESILGFKDDKTLPKFERCEIPENEPNSLIQGANTEDTKEKQLFLSEGGW